MRVHDKKEFDQQNCFGQGQANTAYAQWHMPNILSAIPI